MSSKITLVPLKQNLLITKASGAIDYSDVFQLKSKKLVNPPEPKDCMIAFFKAFPKSFKFLLNVREKIAKQLRLKTAPETDKASRLERLHNFKGEVGDAIAIFEVLDKSNIELLTGQTDDHLDFKLSFVSYTADNPIIELATTVKINNKIGKLYFSIVRPIHKYYMKVIMLRMEKILLNKDW